MGNAKNGISIVMPAYNSEKTIESAIKSVLKQTFVNWELIIIDDYSTDRTLDVITSYVNRFPQIKLISKNVNEGVASARNTGIDASKYEWIAFLDSDDLWESKKLEKQVECSIRNPQASLFYTGTAYCDSAGKKKNYTLDVPQSIDFNQLLAQNIISCSSVLVKREEVFKHRMPEDNRLHEDFATWLQVLADGGKAYGVTEPLLIYRISETSKSGNKLASALMNWNVYRYVGVSFFKSVILMCKYAFKNVYKYFMIKNS